MTAIVAKQSLLLQTLSLLYSPDKSNNLFDLSSRESLTLLNCVTNLQEEFVIHPNLIKSLPRRNQLETAFEGAAIAAKQSLLLQTLSLLLSLKEIHFLDFRR